MACRPDARTISNTGAHPLGCCLACAADGPLAVVAYPEEERGPIGLCSACARDAVRLRAFVRALKGDAGAAPLAPRADGV